MRLRKIMSKTRTEQSENNLEQNTQEKNLTHKAYTNIRRMLLLNEIIPGQRLRYRDLADQLEMSPTPVAQALNWMAFQGLVCHEPNRGYYVKPLSMNDIDEL